MQNHGRLMCLVFCVPTRLGHFEGRGESSMKRIIRLGIGAGLAGLAIAFYLALSGPKTVTPVQAASLPGTATLTGTVDSSKPFKAAQVYLRLPAKRMVY